MLADARVTKTCNCRICFTLARGMAGTGDRGGRVWSALLRGRAGGAPGVAEASSCELFYLLDGPSGQGLRKSTVRRKRGRFRVI